MNPLRGLRAYVQSVVRVCGWRFLALLCVTQFLLKGLAFRIAVASVLPFFKHLGLDAVAVQLYTALIMSPWTVKPLVGVLSDVVALGGYHKRYWMVGSVGVGVAGVVTLLATALPLHSVGGAVAGLALLHLEIAVCDLLSEGKYAEVMRDNPESGSRIVSLVNGMQTLGAIVAMLIVGPLGDHQAFAPIFVLLTVLAPVVLLPLLLGWMPEERAARVVDLPKLRRTGDWKLLGLIALVGLLGPSLSFITIFGSRVAGLVCAAVFLAGSVAGGYALFDVPLIGQVAAYQVLSRVMQPALGSALDFFYTADGDCLPNGPHFSYFYYVSLTGILGALVALGATFLYESTLARWRFRRVLILTTILSACAGLFDVAIVLRWNTLLGIPDKAFYFFGEAIVESGVQMLFWIPSSTILSKVVPEGREAAVYAYMAGLSNFAGTAAELSGAMIYDWAGVSTTPEPECHFEALGVLILICHIALPLTIGIPAAWLIPDRYQTDDLLLEIHHEAGELELEEMPEGALE